MSFIRNLQSLAGIREEESFLASRLFLHNFFSGLSLSLGYSAAYTLFLSDFKADKFPWVLLAAALVLILTGRVYAWLEHHVPLARLFSSLPLVIAVGAVAVRGLYAFWPSAAVVVGIFVAHRIGYLLANLEFWGLSAIALDVRQSKRLFGFIGSGDIPAKLLGYLSIKMVIPLTGAANLLLIAAGAMLISWYFLQSVIGKVDLHADHSHHSHHHAGHNHRWKAFFGHDLIWNLGWISFFALICFTVIEFSFLIEVKEQFVKKNLHGEGHHAGAEVEVASFIGNFFALGALVAGIIKVFLSGRIFSGMGMFRALLISPLSLIAATLTSLVAMEYLGGKAGMAISLWGIAMTADVMRYGIHEPLFLTFFQPLNRHLRLKGHTLVKGLFDPAGLAIAGLVLLFSVLIWKSVSLLLMNALVLASLGIWLVFSFTTYRHYLYSLKEAVRRRFAGWEGGEIEFPEGVEGLMKRIQSHHAEEAVYALEMIRKHFHPDWQHAASRGLKHEADEVKEFVIRHWDFKPSPTDLKRIREESGRHTSLSTRQKASELSGKWDEGDPEEFISRISSLPHEERLAALAGMLENPHFENAITAGREWLRMLASQDRDMQLDALLVAEQIHSVKIFRPLLPFLAHDDGEIRKAAIRAAGASGNENLVGPLLTCMKEDEFRSSVISVMPAFGRAGWEAIDASDIRGHERVAIRTAGDMQHRDAIHFLLGKATQANAEIRLEALHQLHSFDLHENREGKKILSSMLAAEAPAFAVCNALFHFTDSSHKPAFQEELRNIRERVILMLGLEYGSEIYHETFRNLTEADAERRANAMEVLENRLPASVFRTVVPFFEEKTSFVMPFDSALQEMVRMGESAVHPWTLATALQICRNKNIRIPAEWLQPLLQTESASLREAVSYFLAQTDLSMNTTHESTSRLLEFEKVWLLRSTEIFSGTPEQVLSEIAGIVQEVEIKKGEPIFSNGDLGTCMYIIIEGKVRIHNGATTLATLGKKDFFGELSLLDPEPRSGSATADEDSLLLKIDQGAFYELMSERPEIARGILRVLCRRIRRQNELIRSGNASAS